MHDKVIRKAITVCSYRKIPFIAPQGPFEGFDHTVLVELPVELVRLIQSHLVEIIYFSGDSKRDRLVWKEMKGFTNFESFILDVQRQDHPCIILMPDLLLPPYRSMFKEHGVSINEYNARNTVSNKLCRLGIYDEEKGTYCEVVEEASGIN